MTDYIIADRREIPSGHRIIVELEGIEIGVFNVDGELFAYLNWCVHQGAPCCEGEVSGKYVGSFDPESLETTFEWIREGEFLYCPWHAWEYDLKTGECLSNRNFSLPSFPVREENGKIVVSISQTNK